MGLDDLLDSSTSEDNSTSPELKANVSTGGSETSITNNTEPSTGCLPETKNCPNCGSESVLYDDVWRCKMEWCGVSFFLTEQGHFSLPLEDDDTFLSGYSV